MNNNENKRNNINSIMDYISKRNGDVLLDFNTKRDSDDFFKYTENGKINIVKLADNKKELNGKVVLLTYSGKIRRLQIYAGEIHSIEHHEVIIPTNKKSPNPVNFKQIFNWKYDEEIPVDFYLIYYIEDFIGNYFEKSQRLKPSFLFSNGHDISRINKDIEYLKYSAVLTARLAIFIYKICTWNFNISGTKVGNFFASYYKKSKIYNNKEFDIKNTKGYFIHAMYDYKIVEERLKIAEYLLKNSFNDLELLSQATKLPFETIQDMCDAIMQRR